MHDLHDERPSCRRLDLVAAGVTLAVVAWLADPGVVLGEPFAAGQGGQEPPVAGETAAAQEPPPIPLEELGQRAVDAAAAANQAIEVAAPVEIVDEIETDLTAQEAAFSEREQIAVILSGAPPLLWLDDQTAMWRGRGAEADSWGTQLDARIQHRVGSNDAAFSHTALMTHYCSHEHNSSVANRRLGTQDCVVIGSDGAGEFHSFRIGARVNESSGL